LNNTKIMKSHPRMQIAKNTVSDISASRRCNSQNFCSVESYRGGLKKVLRGL
jgi:hypothetical protein